MPKIAWIRKEHVTCDITMLFVLKIQELRSKLGSNMGLSHSGRLSFSPLLAKSGDFGSIPQVHMAQHVVSRDFVKKKSCASGSVLNNSL